MKKTLSQVAKICIGSSIVSVVSMILTLWLLDLKSPLAGLFSMFFIAAGVTAIVSLIIVIIRSIKKIIKDKRKPFEIILAIWKWFIIIEIGFVTLMVLISLITWKNLFTIQVTISPVWDCVINAIEYIITLTVIYGIFNKNYIGYYASEILCIFGIVFDIVSIIVQTNRTLIYTLVLIPFIIFYIFIAYHIHKNRKYFGVKK